MESYIQNMFAERIGGSKFGKETVLYKFEKLKGQRQKQKSFTLTWNSLIWELVNLMKKLTWV